MKDIIDFLVPSFKSFHNSFDVSIYQFTHDVHLEVEKKFLVSRRQSSCISYFHFLRKINDIRKRADRGTDLTNALRFLKSIKLQNINKRKQKVLVVLTDSSLGC